MRILVTGLGGMAGGNVAKLLPKDSVVAACDANPDAKSELDRLGLSEVKFFTVPHESNKDAFKIAINQIVIRYNIDTIIPTVDEELMTLSYRPEHIDAKVIVSPYATIRSCYDKAKLYEAVKGERFAPKFVVTDTRSDLTVFGTSQVFKKPRIGRGSRGIANYQNYTEIPEKEINKDNVFCQFLPGQEYTTDCLFDMQGDDIAIIPRKRLEIIEGKSSKGETQKHAEISENVKKLSSIFKFIGAVNIQFKPDSEGTMKIVEINPRFSGGLPITAASGANTPEMLYSILNGQKVCPPEWKEGVFENNLIQQKRLKGT